MRPLLLAMALSTPVFAGMLWRWLVVRRREWQREQARRQDLLMREDVECWTDRVAWSLAMTGQSFELDRVRPLPKPTLRHTGELGYPWLFVLRIWFASVLLCWGVFTVMIPERRRPR